MVARNLEALNWFVDVTTRPQVSRWRAWHNPKPRTSQRRAIQQLGLDVTLLEGGNRSGKTEAALQLVMVHALGGDHPYTQAWCRRNHIDPATIPSGPGHCWIVALTSTASLLYHRERVAALVPEADWIEFRNRWNKGDAVLRIQVPGYAQPAEIWFRSCGDGREGLQGDACRMILVDEEPPYECWEECSFRVGREPLRMVLSCVWKKGRTKLYQTLVEDGRAPALVRHELDVLDNNSLPEDVLEQIRRKLAALPENVRKARRFGAVAEITDRVYETFSESLHVIKPFDIPEHWDRGRVMDWGYTNPTVVLWFAIDSDGRMIFYREHRRSKRLAKWHGKRVQKLSGDESYRLEWADPSAASQIAEMKEYGIRFKKADNAVDEGILDVLARLEPDGTGKPRVLFFSTCRGTIQEMSIGYRRDPRTGKAIDKDNHGPDCVRYAVRGVDGKRGTTPRLDSGGLERQNPYKM